MKELPHHHSGLLYETTTPRLKLGSNLYGMGNSKRDELITTLKKLVDQLENFQLNIWEDKDKLMDDLLPVVKELQKTSKNSNIYFSQMGKVIQKDIDLILSTLEDMLFEYDPIVLDDLSFMIAKTVVNIISYQNILV